MIIRGGGHSVGGSKSGTALDAAKMPRLMVVSIFSDTRGGDDDTYGTAHLYAHTEGTIQYFMCRLIKEYHKTFYDIP